MAPFAGWDMPVEYSGITAEHMAVRTRAGVFDVSHMGEIEVAGKDALAAIQRISSNDASKLSLGQAHYAGLLTPDGTYVDDMLVYRMGPNHFMLVVNASNVAKDFAWISEQIKPAGDVACVDSSSRYALIAIQGPAAREVLQPLTGVDLGNIKYYWFAHGEVANARAIVSRTGYTGEDGFELFVDARRAGQVWDALMEAGEPFGLKPCGLGSRDTLRLEAGMPLYGNELDRETNPYEANLGRVVKLDKGEFSGRAALASVQQAGPRRKLVGLVMRDGAIARHGYPVHVDGSEAGSVTSGTASPTLGEPIAMAYVPAEDAAPGREVEVVVRERPHRADQVMLPFYKRPKPDAG